LDWNKKQKQKKTQVSHGQRRGMCDNGDEESESELRLKENKPQQENPRDGQGLQQ
jgi:hypothetical protein